MEIFILVDTFCNLYGNGKSNKDWMRDRGRERKHDWMLLPLNRKRRRKKKRRKQSLPFLHYITSTCKNIHSDSIPGEGGGEKVSDQSFPTLPHRGESEERSNNITLYENVILWHNIKKYKVPLSSFQPILHICTYIGTTCHCRLLYKHHITSIQFTIQFISFSLSFFSFSHFVS